MEKYIDARGDIEAVLYQLPKLKDNEAYALFNDKTIAIARGLGIANPNQYVFEVNGVMLHSSTYDVPLSRFFSSNESYMNLYTKNTDGTYVGGIVTRNTNILKNMLSKRCYYKIYPELYVSWYPSWNIAQDHYKEYDPDVFMNEFNKATRKLVDKLKKTIGDSIKEYKSIREELKGMKEVNTATPTIGQKYFYNGLKFPRTLIEVNGKYMTMLDRKNVRYAIADTTNLYESYEDNKYAIDKKKMTDKMKHLETAIKKYHDSMKEACKKRPYMWRYNE